MTSYTTQVTETLRLLNINITKELRAAGYVLAKNESAIGILQSDNARELIYGDFAKLCTTLQISQCKSSAYLHENMALIERMHGVIFTIVRPFLQQAGFPKCLWPFAALHVIYIKNRLPSKNQDDGKSSYCLFYGSEPDDSHVRVFGCDAYSFEDQASRNGKLSPKGQKVDIRWGRC